MKNKKMLSSILAISLSVVTLLSVSSAYAWIKREWSPEVSSPELTVQTNGSLSIKLAETSASLDAINLNDILGLTEDFRLQQVSSLTGETDTFYGINYAAGKGLEELRYLNRTSGTASSFAKSNGYIEQVFILCCQAKEEGNKNFIKHIFIDNESSYIDLYNTATGGIEDASEALRVSITIEGGQVQGVGQSSNTHYIFKKDKSVLHQGATYTVASGNTIPNEDGKRIYTLDEDTNLANGFNQAVMGTNYATHDFADYNGGAKDSTGKYIISNDDHTLFTMSNVETRKVTIRIWLEGYDPHCVDEIAGSKIRFKMVFKSVDTSEDTTSN